MTKFEALIRAERERQDAKWGANRNLANEVWLTILTEEVGEAAKAMLEEDKEGLKLELVQIAAVTVAWMECIAHHEEKE